MTDETRQPQPLRYKRHGLVFPTVKGLNRRLGVEGALIDMIELAVLDLVDRAGTEDPIAYVAAIKRRHKVPSNFANLGELKMFASTLYLVSAVNAIDRFLRDFRRDILTFRECPDRDDKTTAPAIDRLLELLPGHRRRLCKDRPEYRLLAYYFDCRHYLVHATPLERLIREYEQLTHKHGTVVREQYRRSPNAPQAWTNGDRILCSRALRTFADVINDEARLTASEVAFWMTRHGVLGPRLRASGPRRKLRRVVAKLAREQFEATAQTADEVATTVEELIAAKWAAD